ncbi:hypothetical protein BO83DRAFT_366081 [Aspergillus eucalypticola CBS 122712]|uniref:Uncharacterized protein n=1 Tax=Aspergillus eucalypticola (strain CBS 122712 / IBT 29274) TaxID=1448314 RepID=A0A317V025_ASPEC|nr:uncharacterized protein BO83DRAFT_366081 [Aspergillus eucalypticola CBS 122712]PWY67405.1 hypothetical protein BO83DRAFT_366081 [Aspergillus eucalypticola CBS 122712]
MGDFVHKCLCERETNYEGQLSQLHAESSRSRDETRHSINTDQGGDDVPSADPESITALKYFSQPQGQESQADAAGRQSLAETENGDYEASTSILQSLTAKVISEGFLDPVDGTAVQSAIPEISDKKRQSVKNTMWQSTDIRNTEYSYQLKEQVRRHIYIYYCEIIFPHDMDIRDNKIFIKIELCPLEETHTNLYAISSSENHDDPALRLAFRVRYHDSFGREVIYYATNSGGGVVFKANTLVDVLEKKSLEEIAQIPRRHIYIGTGNDAHPELERFRNGSYTSKLP